jgi:hypothetical protein
MSQNGAILNVPQICGTFKIVAWNNLLCQEILTAVFNLVEKSVAAISETEINPIAAFG